MLSLVSVIVRRVRLSSFLRWFVMIGRTLVCRFLRRYVLVVTVLIVCRCGRRLWLLVRRRRLWFWVLLVRLVRGRISGVSRLVLVG